MTEKEMKIEKSISPVTIEGHINILNQMNYAICRIYKGEGKYGTGFLCKNSSNTNDYKTFLVTSYNVINENNKTIQLILKDGKSKVELKIDQSRKTYFNQAGISIIEIKKTDNLQYFLELDINSVTKGLINTSIYIISYQKNQKVSVSYGTVKDFKDITICHNCSTDSASIGSPLLNLKNNKVIGLHLGINKNNINVGALILGFVQKYIKSFNEFKSFQSQDISESQVSNNNNPPFGRSISQPIGQISININDSIFKKTKVEKTNIIELKLFASKEDIKNKIYFLNNQKEFNEDNIEVYINNEKTKKFKSYFRPEEVKVYSIKLLFKQNITDCTEMFQDCKNITFIDLSNLRTENVKDMSYMFNNCSNLTTINLFSLETLNVYKMRNMFCFCTKLCQISGLSSFNTSNVFDMHEMFFGCESLTNLNLSSFDFTNVNDLKYMLFNCHNLKILHIKHNFLDRVKSQCNHHINKINCI